MRAKRKLYPRRLNSTLFVVYKESERAGIVVWTLPSRRARYRKICKAWSEETFETVETTISVPPSNSRCSVYRSILVILVVLMMVVLMIMILHNFIISTLFDTFKC